MYLTYNLSK